MYLYFCLNDVYCIWKLQLDVPHSHQLVLVDADLMTPTGLQSAIAAARVLQRAMGAETRPGTDLILFLEKFL